MDKEKTNFKLEDLFESSEIQNLPVDYRTVSGILMDVSKDDVLKPKFIKVDKYNNAGNYLALPHFKPISKIYAYEDQYINRIL